MKRAVVFCFVVVVVVGVGTGCPFWPDHELGEEAEGETLVAFGRDFEGYESWPHAVVGSAPIEGGHDTNADRTVFINALPADDDDAFPVGTIIVKEGSGKEAEGGTGTQTHAMVKRGGSFNADGAAGWEFFEIEKLNGHVLLVWRGEEPPDGESYGCLSGDCASGFTSCNECHAGARANDFVLSQQLTLHDFDASLLRP